MPLLYWGTTCITITDQETDDQYTNTSTSIYFHIYHLIAHCTKHGRIPLTDKNIYCKCQQDTASGQPTKIYTRRELVMMEKTISNFHTSFYIPAIQKLAFKISHVKKLSTNRCGDSLRNSFKPRESFKDVLCCRDYDEKVVASFAHLLKP